VKNIILILLLSTFVFADSIKVAVAANVSYAIKPLIKEFNKTNKTKIKIILGSSGKLTALITNGAPYDLFLSANIKYPNFLYKNKIGIKKPEIYTKGSLVLFSSKKRDLKDISIINDVKKIAIANPKTAPYGKAAHEAISNAKLLENNINKLIYAENISQTVQYSVVAADVGFIAKSSLYSPKMQKYKKNVNYVDINKNLYKPINQAILLLKNNQNSLAFYEFILSNKAKKIFKKYGYNVE
jgi:molybdate transport system substrate-binding protein